MSPAAAARLWRIVRTLHAKSRPVYLIWIPDIVRAYAAEMRASHATAAMGAVWPWLREGRSAGLFDLRVESGMGRISAEDVNLCPRDSDRRPLSNLYVIRWPSAKKKRV